uniref:Reverse transcriptase domain-containing protein n=1 Tax=Photinus pyralis TaxID=7054 RepID=A0A1Y1K8S0_PHOPY
MIFSDSLKKEFRLSHKGVPQGGVLSPLLYLIYVRDITEGVPKTVTISQFVDDIVMYCSYGNVEKFKSLVQKAVNITNANLGKIGLGFEPDKTAFLHINCKKIKPGETVLNLCGKDSCESIRFLGIVIDYKLSFIPHLNSVVAKCATRSNILKFLCGVKWGSHPSTLLILYKSFVRSIIDYCSFVYFPTATIHVEKLEKVQIACLRTALGLRRTTPNNVVLAESKLQSIQERSKSLGKCYFTKILSNSILPSFQTIQSIIHNKNGNRNTIKLNEKPNLLKQCILDVTDLNIKAHKNYNIYCFDYNVLKTSLNVNYDLGKHMKIAKDPNTILNAFLRENNSHVVFTDGSKTNDQT